MMKLVNINNHSHKFYHDFVKKNNTNSTYHTRDDGRREQRARARPPAAVSCIFIFRRRGMPPLHIYAQYEMSVRAHYRQTHSYGQKEKLLLMFC